MTIFGIDKVGKLLHKLQQEFDLPTFELVEIAKRVMPGRPWKMILRLAREEANGKRKDGAASG